MPDMGNLPGNTRFLHIGPHKTGTTAVQGAFNLARPRLAQHGLTYIGEGRQPVKAAQQATGRPPMFGAAHTRGDYWKTLLKEVRNAGDKRPVISSEFFCEADDDAARRIIEDLGGSRVHVIVTLRPLTRILAAQWQQYVQNGLRTPYEKWLDGMFNKPPYTHPNPTFWHRHQQGLLVGRWAEVVGPENLTVIAVDDSDRGMLLRSFEELTDLPGGFLVPDDTQENRSLSYGEAELVRQLNGQFRSQEWETLLYGRYIRQGAVRNMKVNYRPTGEEARIPTPLWAMERAAKIGAESAETIAALGTRVMGDLGVLSDLPENRVGKPPAKLVSPKAAAHAVLGAMTVGEGAIPAPAANGPVVRAGANLRNVTIRQMAREVLARGVRRGRRMRWRLLAAWGKRASA